jgi:hypothetical protein
VILNLDADNPTRGLGSCVAYSFDLSMACVKQMIGYHVDRSSDKGVAHLRRHKDECLLYGIDNSFMPCQENNDTVWEMYLYRTRYAPGLGGS